MTRSDFTVEILTDEERLVTTGKVLDNTNADTFASLLMDMHASGVQSVYIDMTALEFLSSAGIGSIVGTVALFRERSGDIQLRNVSAKINHILDVLDLADYLTIERREDHESEPKTKS